MCAYDTLVRVRRIEQDGVAYLEFDVLRALGGVRHGSFLRHGGCSTGPFNSLNFSSSTGDALDAVAANIARVKAIMGVTTLCRLQQSHGSHIVIADPACVEAGDGLVTNQPGVALLILHADCQAALFFDPKQRVIAAVHCGWRGNVANIYAQAVQVMERSYGTVPADVRVAISPSLGPQAAEFRNYHTELPSSFLPFRVGPTHFDLWAVALMQLKAAGIREEHVEIAGLCTYTAQEDCYSYRREKMGGRHGTLIVLDP